jgi:hypothetical protein
LEEIFFLDNNKFAYIKIIKMKTMKWIYQILFFKFLNRYFMLLLVSSSLTFSFSLKGCHVISEKGCCMHFVSPIVLFLRS